MDTPPPVKSRVAIGFHRNTGTDSLEGGSHSPLSNTLMTKKDEKERCHANSGDPEQTPRSVATDLGVHCLAMSHKMYAMFKWVKVL